MTGLTPPPSVIWRKALKVSDDDTLRNPRGQVSALSKALAEAARTEPLPDRIELSLSYAIPEVPPVKGMQTLLGDLLNRVRGNHPAAIITRRLTGLRGPVPTLSLISHERDALTVWMTMPREGRDADALRNFSGFLHRNLHWLPRAYPDER